MITEEALPTYQTLINRFEATKDITGKDDSNWGKWTRWWSAEENRHGDLLHAYLGFIPRLNARAIERDIQHLIGSGFDPGIGEDPYKLIVYTSFQERATFISHMGTALIAKEQGDENLHNICSVIAKDEARHFGFYKEVMGKIFDEDSNGAMNAYGQMMKQTISMPAREMNNIKNPNLFNDFSNIAQSIDVYTASDYAGIIEHLNKYWKIENRNVTTDESLKAQEYLINLPDRYLKLSLRKKDTEFKFDKNKFDWLK